MSSFLRKMLIIIFKYGWNETNFCEALLYALIINWTHSLSPIDTEHWKIAPALKKIYTSKRLT